MSSIKLPISHNGVADQYLTKAISDKPTKSYDAISSGDWVRNALVEPDSDFTSVEVAIVDSAWRSDFK